MLFYILESQLSQSGDCEHYPWPKNESGESSSFLRVVIECQVVLFLFNSFSNSSNNRDTDFSHFSSGPAHLRVETFTAAASTNQNERSSVSALSGACPLARTEI